MLSIFFVFFWSKNIDRLKYLRMVNDDRWDHSSLCLFRAVDRNRLDSSRRLINKLFRTTILRYFTHHEIGSPIVTWLGDRLDLSWRTYVHRAPFCKVHAANCRACYDVLMAPSATPAFLSNIIHRLVRVFSQQSARHAVSVVTHGV